MNTEKRLARLEVVWRRRERPAEDAGSPFDATRLTFAEQGEMDGLLALLEPAGRRGRPDYGALADAQVERLDQLNRKARGVPPEPVYFGMHHRDPGIGPCRCVACDRGPRPNAGDCVGGTP